MRLFDGLLPLPGQVSCACAACNGLSPSRTLLSTLCNAAASTTEPAESIAYQQDLNGGENGIHDHGDIPARYRNDPQDTRDHAYIRRAFAEDALEHDQTDHENPKGETTMA